MRLGSIISAGGLALGLVLGLVLAQATAAVAAPAGDYTVTAHRGGWIVGSSITENSYRALGRAARHGATAIETDVRMTRDRAFLIMHDASLRRTTDGIGWVDSRNKRYINRRVRLDNGQRVPYLAGLLRRARSFGLNVVIELKADRRDRWTVEDLQRMVQVIAAHDMTDRVTFLSFDDSLLRLAEEADSSLPTVWIATTPPASEDVAARGVDGVAVRWDQITPELAGQFTDAGIGLRGRDADDPAAWEAFKEVGITNVVTDLTPARVEWLGQPVA